MDKGMLESLDWYRNKNSDVLASFRSSIMKFNFNLFYKFLVSIFITISISYFNHQRIYVVKLKKTEIKLREQYIYI